MTNGRVEYKLELVKSLSDFFKRDLVAIPLVKKHPHSTLTQRCNLKAATLELDTSAHPNIEYIAGTRLSVYPTNPSSHVHSIMEHLIDDLSLLLASPTSSPQAATTGQPHSPSQQVAAHLLLFNNNNNLIKFIQQQQHGGGSGDTLKLVLTHLYDIETAPSRELVRLLADNCSNREQRRKLAQVCHSNETWEKWVCGEHRTLKSVLDECSSCRVSACKLLQELTIQQPRQYSISNIKSAKRFRAEIVVIQHKFTLRQIEFNMHQVRERETYETSTSTTTTTGVKSNLTKQQQQKAHSAGKSASANSGKQNKQLNTNKKPQQRSRSPSHTPPPVTNDLASTKSSVSVRSIRSLASFATSPITTHQVKQVPSFSGPLMSMYASATTASLAGGQQQSSVAMSSLSGFGSKTSLLSTAPDYFKSDLNGNSTATAGLKTTQEVVGGTNGATKQPSPTRSFDGLCSNFLLNLTLGDQIVCEFVENPRFTLKGNRERPVMMIGQDLGLIAFRPFWQQRALEHDRAQVFYTLFEDLVPKKFGDMQLICVTGNKCKVEDLFKRELNVALASKVLSSISHVHRRQFARLFDDANVKSQLLLSQVSKSNITSVKLESQQQTSNTANNQQQQQHLQINSKELLELGNRIYKLLVEHNGCLYTCCDPHITQAIEILIFESIARNNSQLTRERLMKLLPKWKGSDQDDCLATNTQTHKRNHHQHQDDAALFKLENTFERAQIVEEIYDVPI